MLKQPTLEHPNAVVAIIANNAREGSAIVHPEPPPKRMPNDLPCIHRGTEIVRSIRCKPCQNAGMEMLPVHTCAVHGECVVRGYALDAPKVCLTCDERRKPGDPDVIVKRIAPAKGMMFNRANEPADWLGDQFAGCACMLVCGGPSVREMDLTRLQERGVFVAALSQIAATHVRPHAWFSVDKCSTYHPAIWRDPAIMKFVPRVLRNDVDNGTLPHHDGHRWHNGGPQAWKCPNVWYYNRGDEWDWDGFLERPWAMWATPVDSPDRVKKSVMLVAIRLLHWLGFRAVYLIGCDFEMKLDRQYAFASSKGQGACRSNNRSYRAINETFVRLRPTMESCGFRVYNASAGGRLDAFERVSLDDAIDACRASFPATIDVTGLYH